MLLSHLAKESFLTFPEGENKCLDINIDFVSAQSYKIKDNSIFFAIEGRKADGHDYVEYAVSKGASAVAVGRGRAKEFSHLQVPVLECDDTRRSFAYAIDAVCDHPSEKMNIISVTGTNGKTSIACILSDMLIHVGIKCGMIGTLGCFINGKRVEVANSDPSANMTTPDPSELYPLLAYMMRVGVTHVVMEASSHASALSKLAPLKISTAIFSNLTPEHLDFHKDINEYFLAKLNILKKADNIIINTDDRFGNIACGMLLNKNIVKVSQSTAKSDFFVENICFLGDLGTSYTIACGNEKYNVAQKLVGRFNVENSSLALACAFSLGVDKTLCLSSLADFCGIPGRMQRVGTGNNSFSVFIDYAHTPDALAKVLSLLKEAKGEKDRLVLLFGCGGDRDRSKRPLMARCAQEADFVIVTSDNSRSEDRIYIIDEILSGFDNEYKSFLVIPDREEAIRFAITNAHRGDIILLAGKGHEKYEIDKTGRHPFDEEEIVLDALKNK